MELRVPDAVVSALADIGYDEKYGARPLRRAIQTNIEDNAAELMLDGKLNRGDCVVASVIDGKIVLTKTE